MSLRAVAAALISLQLVVFKIRFYVSGFISTIVGASVVIVLHMTAAFVKDALHVYVLWPRFATAWADLVLRF